MKRLYKIIKITGGILLLAAFTFLLLELPRQYYAREDARVGRDVLVRDYSVKVNNDTLSFQEKADAFKKENIIITEGDAEILDSQKEGVGKKQQLAEQIATEIGTMLSESLIAMRLQEMLFSPKTTREWFCVKLIEVSDNAIHSFDFGFLFFTDPLFIRGTILFDLDSGKPFFLDAVFYNTETEEGDDQFLENSDDFYQMLDEYYQQNYGENRMASLDQSYISLSCFLQKEAFFRGTLEKIQGYISEKSRFWYLDGEASSFSESP